MNKRWLKNVMLITGLILLVIVGVVGVKTYRKKEATKKFEKVYGELTLQTDVAQEELDKLYRLLESKKDLEDWQIAKVYGWISSIYLFQYDFDNMLQTAEMTILYAEKANRDDIIFWTYIDVGNMFKMIEYNALTIKMLDYARERLDNFEDPEKRAVAEDYLHYHYAWAYLGLGSGDELIEHISYDFQYMEGYSECFYITRHLYKAIGLFNKGDVEGARAMLPMIDKLRGEMEGEEHSPERSINLEGPLFHLKMKLHMADGNLDLAIQQALEVIEYGESHDLGDGYLYFFADFFDLLKKGKFEISEEQKVHLDSFEEILVDRYPNELLKARTQSGEFVLASFFSTIENLRQNVAIQTMETSIIISVIAFFTILISLTFVLRTSLNLNRKDGLTGVFNRMYFNKLYRRYQKRKRLFHLLLLDIDYFKNLNDTYGHEFGDEVLMRMSRHIRGMMSSEDFLFRYGGEEFCIITKKQSKEKVLEFAEKIRTKIERLEWEKDVTVTISMGIASSTEGDSVITMADERLYKSKENGRNRITFLEETIEGEK